MPFWRRNRNETPEREVDEPVDPDFVDPSWEPDPADFAEPGDGAATQDSTDALYGVTVGDDSVSRVISLRLDEAQALAARDQGDLAVAG